MIGYLCEIISTLKNKKSYTITNMVMYYTTIRGAKSGNTKKWGSEDLHFSQRIWYAKRDYYYQKWKH